MVPLVRRLGSWYSTPTGLVSLVCLAIVVVLTVAGQLLVALLVSTGWIAIVLPHKLINERRDWNQAVTAHTTGLQAQIDELTVEVDDLKEKNREVASELTMMPTLEEVRTWQRSVEEAQAAANASFGEELRALGAPGQVPGTGQYPASDQ